MSTASAAPIHRDVKSSSAARWGPTVRGSQRAAPRLGCGAQGREGEPKAGVVGQHHEVAVQQDGGAEPHRGPVHGGEQRLVHVEQRRDQHVEGVPQHKATVLIGQFLEVDTARERPPGAPEDDDQDGGILPRLAQEVGEPPVGGGGEGVRAASGD